MLRNSIARTAAIIGAIGIIAFALLHLYARTQVAVVLFAPDCLDHANVFVDGEFVGQFGENTIIDFWVSAGPHVVTIEKRGFEPTELSWNYTGMAGREFYTHVPESAVTRAVTEPEIKEN